MLHIGDVIGSSRVDMVRAPTKPCRTRQAYSGVDGSAGRVIPYTVPY